MIVYKTQMVVHKDICITTYFVPKVSGTRQAASYVSVLFQRGDSPARQQSYTCAKAYKKSLAF